MPPLSLARRLFPSAWLLALLSAGPALGYTIESPISRGCHERLTVAALHEVGWGEIPAPPRSRDDELLAANLPFQVPENWDPWMLALLIGVRDNDLQGAGVVDLAEHGAADFAPELQSQHCLRSPAQDYAAGDEEAAAACRDYIADALQAGAGPGPGLDREARVAVKVSLKFEQQVVQLPRFAYQLGRALHALQDSYSHTYRSEDLLQVSGVFNFVDPALSSTFDPARDGDAHLSTYDLCDRLTGHAAMRFEAAQQASKVILAAYLQERPAAEIDGAAPRLLTTVGGFLEHQSGCGASGCDAPESYLQEVLLASKGCSSTGDRSAPWMILGLLLGWSGRGRVKARRRSEVGIWAMTGALLLPSVAGAQDSRSPLQLEQQADLSPASLHVRVGGSLDRGGAAFGLGAGWAVSSRVELGVALELAPWIDLLTGSTTLGTGNGYGTLDFFWVESGGIRVGSGLGAGVSMLLFDSVAGGRGSVGPFIQVSLIHLEVPLGPKVALQLRPDFAISVPQMRGVPLVYREYRGMVGLRFRI